MADGLLGILQKDSSLVLEIDDIFIGRNWSLEFSEEEDEPGYLLNATYVDDDTFDKSEWWIDSGMDEAQYFDDRWHFMCQEDEVTIRVFELSEVTDA